MAERDPIDIAAIKKKLRGAYGNARGPKKIVGFGQPIPADYLTFLREVGGGTIGEMFFEIYDKPLNSNDIYGENAPDHLKKILFFGDDYNGFCVGLDPSRDWVVVEIDKYSLQLDVLAETLFEFLMKDPRLDPPVE